MESGRTPSNTQRVITPAADASPVSVVPPEHQPGSRSRIGTGFSDSEYGTESSIILNPGLLDGRGRCWDSVQPFGPVALAAAIELDRAIASPDTNQMVPTALPRRVLSPKSSFGSRTEPTETISFGVQTRSFRPF